MDAIIPCTRLKSKQEYTAPSLSKANYFSANNLYPEHMPCQVVSLNTFIMSRRHKAPNCDRDVSNIFCRLIVIVKQEHCANELEVICLIVY